jgi:alkylation response protein AidB-like acyl-CoA dehydrogenase
MDFGLSEEQTLLPDTIRRYVETECPTTRVRTVMESATGHDPALWRGLAELGVTGLAVPARTAAPSSAARRALAPRCRWCCAPGRSSGRARHGRAPARQRRRRRAGPASRRGRLVTFALGEGLGEWTPQARRDRHGESFRREAARPYADVADAIVVAARDADGPGLWVVERGAPGVTCTSLKVFDMTRRVTMVGFDGTPAAKIAAGRDAIDRARDAGLILVAADAFGGAARCIDMTAKYSLTREQFGQPIGAFQGVKHQLADLVCDLEPARSLWWYAAHAFDHIGDRSERHAALAKAHLTDLFDRVTRYAIELHGGIGFTWSSTCTSGGDGPFDRAFLGEASYHRARPRRWPGLTTVDGRVSRRATTWSALALLLVVASSLLRLRTARTPTTSTSTSTSTSSRSTRRLYRRIADGRAAAGTVSLCGVPWLATLQAGVFYPPHVLYLILPLHAASRRRTPAPGPRDARDRGLARRRPRTPRASSPRSSSACAGSSRRASRRRPTSRRRRGCRWARSRCWRSREAASPGARRSSRRRRR